MLASPEFTRMPDPAPDAARSVVEIDAIRRVFPGPSRTDVVALGGVTLRVLPGQFLALLGPSGCGKTTLLRIIGGLDSPTAGCLRIDGHDMAGVPPERRPVNMVFQSPALFPHMNVFDNIAFGPRMAGVARETLPAKIRAVLSLVRLQGYEKRSVTQLSGGQAQRIAMARALVNQPKVLLLDEPLAALDLKLRREMQLELKSIHRILGTTFIYVTHDQEEAITMADRIVIMRDGELVQDGPPADIYERPNSVFAAQFIGESNVFAGRVIGASREAITVNVDGLHIAAPGGDVDVDREVWVSIRPERITMGRDVPIGMKRSSGEVVESVFQGALVKYRVRLDCGITATVMDPHAHERAVFPVESRVDVSWPDDAVCVLTR